MTHHVEVLPYMVVVLFNCVLLGQCYCPDGCWCSRTVQCSVQELSKVIPFLPRNTSRLDLSSNDIEYIPNGIFTNFTNLEYLSLANNSIRKLHKNSLKGLHNLKELHLQHNPLSSFGTLSHTPALSILRLEGNINSSLLHLSNVGQLTNITLDLFSNFSCYRCHFFRSPSNICLHDPSTCTQLQYSPFSDEDCTCATCSTIDSKLCGDTAVTNLPTWSILGRFVALRVLFWLFGIIALVSNLFMLVALLVSIHYKKSAKSIFIINLTLCDLLISSHVIIIASLDYVTYGKYKEYGKGLWEEKWCSLIFFLKHFGLLSGIFCLALIGLERYLAIHHYGSYTRRISPCKALGYVIECWILGCTLTLVIWFLTQHKWKYLCSVDLGTSTFYNISYVIKYVTASVCIIAVIICLRMYKRTLTTGHKASLGRQSKDALRMSTITLSSLLFWVFPYMGFVAVSAVIPGAFSAQMAVTAITLTLSMMATLHPLFYAYKNQRFRTCFNVLLCKKGSCFGFHCGWIYSCCTSDAYEHAEFEVDSLPHTYNSSQYSSIDDRKLSPIEHIPLEQYPHCLVSSNKRLDFANKAYELSPLVQGNRVNLKVFHDSRNSSISRTTVKFQHDETQHFSTPHEKVSDEDLNQIIPPPTEFQWSDDHAGNIDLQNGNSFLVENKKILPRATLVHFSERGVTSTCTLNTGVIPLQIKYQSRAPRAPRIEAYESKISEKLDRVSLQGTLSGVAAQHGDTKGTPFTHELQNASVNGIGVVSVDNSSEEERGECSSLALESGEGSPLAIRRGITVPPLVFVPEFSQYSSPSSTSSPSDSLRQSLSKRSGNSEPYARHGPVETTIAPYRIPTADTTPVRHTQISLSGVALVECHVPANRGQYSRTRPQYNTPKTFISRGPPIFEAPGPPLCVPPMNDHLYLGDCIEEHLSSLECSTEEMMYKGIKGKHRTNTPENSINRRKYKNTENVENKSEETMTSNDADTVVTKGKLCLSDSGCESSTSNSRIPRFIQKQQPRLVDKPTNGITQGESSRISSSAVFDQTKEPPSTRSMKPRGIPRLSSSALNTSPKKAASTSTGVLKTTGTEGCAAIDRTKTPEKGPQRILKAPKNLKSAECIQLTELKKEGKPENKGEVKQKRDSNLPSRMLKLPQSYNATKGFEQAPRGNKKPISVALKASEKKDVRETETRKDLPDYGVEKVSKNVKKTKKTEKVDTPDIFVSRIPKLPKSRVRSSTSEGESPVKQRSKSASGEKGSVVARRTKGSSEEKVPVKRRKSAGCENEKIPVERAKNAGYENEKDSVRTTKGYRQSASENVPVRKNLLKISEGKERITAKENSSMDRLKVLTGLKENDCAVKERSIDLIRKRTPVKIEKNTPADRVKNAREIFVDQKTNKEKGKSRIPGLIQRNNSNQAKYIGNREEIAGSCEIDNENGNAGDTGEPQTSQNLPSAEMTSKAILCCGDNDINTEKAKTSLEAGTDTDSSVNVNKSVCDKVNLETITGRREDSEEDETSQLKHMDTRGILTREEEISSNLNQTECRAPAVMELSGASVENNIVENANSFGLRQNTVVASKDVRSNSLGRIHADEKALSRVESNKGKFLSSMTNTESMDFSGANVETCSVESTNNFESQQNNKTVEESKLSSGVKLRRSRKSNESASCTVGSMKQFVRGETAKDVTSSGVKMRHKARQLKESTSCSVESMEREFVSNIPDAVILGSVRARRKRSTEERQNARNRLGLHQVGEPLARLDETTSEVMRAFEETSNADDFKETSSDTWCENNNQRLSLFEAQLRDLLLVNDNAQEVAATKCFYVPELQQIIDLQLANSPSLWESAEELLTTPLVPERSIKLAKISPITTQVHHHPTRDVATPSHDDIMTCIHDDVIPRNNDDVMTWAHGDITTRTHGDVITDTREDVTKNISNFDSYSARSMFDDVRVCDDIPRANDIRGRGSMSSVNDIRVGDEIPRKSDVRCFSGRSESVSANVSPVRKVERRGSPVHQLSPDLSRVDSAATLSDKDVSLNTSPDALSPKSGSSVSLSENTLEDGPARRLGKHDQFPPRKGRKNPFCSPVRSRKKSKELKTRHSDEVYQDSTEDENRSPERRKSGSSPSHKKERISAFFSKTRGKSKSESEDSTSEMSSGTETLKSSFLKGLKRGKKHQGSAVTERSSSPLARLKLKRRQNSKDSSTSDLEASSSNSPAKLEENDTVPELPSRVNTKTKDHRESNSSLASRQSLASIASRHSNASLLSRLSQISSRASLDWDPSLQLTDCHFDYDFMPPPPPPPPGVPPSLPGTPPTTPQGEINSNMIDFDDKNETMSLSSTANSRGSMEWDPTGIQLRLSMGPGDDRIYFCQELDFDGGPTTSV